jgi:fumarylacetoacetase
MDGMLDATHDPGRRSHVAAANDAGSDFPIQNIPFGIFSVERGARRIGIAIGDRVLDLKAAFADTTPSAAARAALHAVADDDLTALLALGRPTLALLRGEIATLLDERYPRRNALAAHLIPMDAVELHLPATVTAFTDMCVSTFHIGRRRGLDANGQPLCPPAFRTVPIGYDGRASSVRVSGQPVRRPNGTWQPEHDGGEPRFGPEPRLDYELELGMWLGGPTNPDGTPMTVARAEQRIVGFCLLNDWSARGIQFWETMLGPFLGKSIATTVSPWIVTADALAPFRTTAFARPPCDPRVPDHLHDPLDQRLGGIDLTMEAWRRGDGHRGAQRLCRTNFSYMYWTPAQMIAHHASNGCQLSAGNLIGSGTCSGPDIDMAGCLIERIGTASAAADAPRWLADGDTVVLRARADREGYRSIGFGEARATVLPALPWSEAAQAVHDEELSPCAD